MQSLTTKNQKLQEFLANAEVPTLPIVAQKLVALCRDDKADFADFARLIGADPGFAARLLRVANTAFYGQRNKVTTLDRAIATLGLKYVKSISLGFYLATTLNHCKNGEFDMREFWRQNILRGVLARQIAGVYCPPRREEAFLVGLLQDCGIPLLVEAFGERYLHIWKDCRYSQAALFRLERELFDFDHLDAAGVIAGQCALPDLLSEPIRCHHLKSQSVPSLDETVQLSQIAYFVGTLCFNSPDTISEEDVCLSEYYQTAFGIDAGRMKKILADTRDEFNNIAQMFKDILPENINPIDLLANAKNLLSGLAGESQQEILDLKREIETLTDQHRQLSQDIDLLRQKALIDDLTGLVNREDLLDFLERAASRVVDPGESLAVFYLAVEDLKQVNQRFGYPAGDQVLKKISDLLRQVLTEDICLSRCQGTQFIAAALGLQAQQALKFAKILIQKISDTGWADVCSPPVHSLTLDSYIGLLYCPPGCQPGPAARILELAQTQMENARAKGANSLHLEILSPQTK
jgi:two-component system, cell cycle response regulator